MSKEDQREDELPKPSVVEAAVCAILGHRNWSACSDIHEAHKVWGEDMVELEAALRAEGHGAELDKGILELDTENHEHGECRLDCKAPAHVSPEVVQENLRASWRYAKARLDELRVLKAQIHPWGGTWGGGTAADDLIHYEELERTCSEEEFWALTEPFGWGTKTTDSTAIEVALLQQLTPVKAEALRAQLDKLTNVLHTRLQTRLQTTGVYQELGCGDDSYSDLLAHIVGLGHVAYSEAMLYPQRVKERCDNRKFTESFAYALPHADKFKYLTLQHYIHRATELHNQYDKAYQNEDLREIHAHAQIVIETAALVQEGMITAAVEREAATRGAADKIAKFYHDRAKQFGAVMIDGGSIANPHTVYNFFNDLKTYYVPFQKKPA